METVADDNKSAYGKMLDAELLDLAVLDGEWLAPAEKLLVYKESALLLSDVCSLTLHFDKKDRAFSEELRCLGLRLMSLIYVANHKRRDSIEQMNEALEVLTYMRMLCRVCVHIHVMPQRHYAQIAPRFDNIGRQLSGWIRQTRKIMEQQSNSKK